MNVRNPLFKLLAGATVLAVLSAMFLSTSPPPNESPVAVLPSRELDEAAEEVRAVATGMRRLEEKISDQAARFHELQDSLSQVNHRVEQLAQRQQEQEAPPTQSPPSPAAAQEASPLTSGGEDFDLSTLTHESQAILGLGDVLLPDRSLTWVEPVGSGGVFAHDLGEVSGRAVERHESEEQLRFFIPPSILSGVSLTALVGRIPRGGTVQDPWPFVAISQDDNLTSNGVRLPQLRGILWRGVVRGDAALACASASVRSMVYLFDDGVFHVAKAPDQEGFGYLADKSGNPCLMGEVHTTAPESMSAHLLAGILAGAGGAFAESQVRRSTAAGTETASVGGDAFSYLLGQTVQGAASTYGDYLLRYANDVWDAVVVPAGREVDIHVTDAIPVFHSPTRTIHENPASPTRVLLGGLD